MSDRPIGMATPTVEELEAEIERLRKALAESCDENRLLVLEEGPWSTDTCPIAGKLNHEIKRLRAALERIAAIPVHHVGWREIAREALENGND